jgi:hypothetical protein
MLNQTELYYQETCDTSVRMDNAMLAEFAAPEILYEVKLTRKADA